MASSNTPTRCQCPRFPASPQLSKIIAADAQESLACKENSDTAKEGCQRQPAAHTAPGEPLSALSNYVGAQGWAFLLPITVGATPAQGTIQAWGMAGCPQQVSVSHVRPCGFSSSSHCIKSREFLNDIPH